MDKGNLRKKYREIRKNIKDKEQKSDIIFQKLIETKFYQNSKVIAIYKNLKEEVNTSKMIEYMLNDEKIAVIPRTEGKGKMNFFRWEVGKKTSINKFGIEEPEYDKNKIINENEIDTIIVPGICFDEKKNRIGFGGGYYDSYLQNFTKTKIGICFEEQVYSQGINADVTDIKMDLIITEKRIIS